MLTGRSLSPHEALKAGLVDAVVEREALRAKAKEFVIRRPPRHRAPWYLAALNTMPVRRVLAPRVRAGVRKRANAKHYPAPYAIVDLWERYGARGEAAMRAEALSIGRLLVTPTCRNLVHVFKLRERLRNLAPKDSSIRRVHVVGAGTMGGDIAAWCALKGLDVTVQDCAQQYVEPALARAAELFRKRLRAPEKPKRRRDACAWIFSGRGRLADLVVEAIVEKAEAKRALFADLEPRCPLRH
jgi:3-hydroxyacyl-CoA dehydrogenase/enoyl-CoA hydratase/3-hydroxybutyryl-CoA epimerase